MSVNCRLRELMGRHIAVKQLAKDTGLSEDVISNLRTGNWTTVSREALERIPTALGVTLNDLFEIYPQDIWAPIRRGRQVTVHFGFNSFEDGAPRGGRSRVLQREFVGSWDVRAFFAIWEYLSTLGVPIRLDFEWHITGGGRGVDSAVQRAVTAVFEKGNHIIIGSPLANQFTEEVVSHAYGVRPYSEDPETRRRFPYVFAWDSRVTTRSSFGERRAAGPVGVVSTRTGIVAAKHTHVRKGPGKDCALVVTYRCCQPSALRRTADDDERIIIVILGHSGPGTLAGAKVAIDKKYAAGLHPPDRNAPHMRAVEADYYRSEASRRDNRTLEAQELVNTEQSS